MVTVNINTADGLVNGASGELMAIDINSQTNKPSTLWFDFRDESVGTDARSKKKKCS